MAVSEIDKDLGLSYEDGAEEEPREKFEEPSGYELPDPEDPKVKEKIRQFQREQARAITLLQNRQNHYYGTYCDIFLDLFDQQIAFEVAKTNFTNSLLKNGYHANATRVYSQVEMISRRLSSIALTQRLLDAMGLHAHHDEIVSHELTLLYRTSQTPAKLPPPDQSKYNKDGTREDLPVGGPKKDKK